MGGAVCRRSWPAVTGGSGISLLLRLRGLVAAGVRLSVRCGQWHRLGRRRRWRRCGSRVAGLGSLADLALGHLQHLGSGLGCWRLLGWHWCRHIGRCGVGADGAVGSAGAGAGSCAARPVGRRGIAAIARSGAAPGLLRMHRLLLLLLLATLAGGGRATRGRCSRREASGQWGRCHRCRLRLRLALGFLAACRLAGATCLGPLVCLECGWLRWCIGGGC